MIFSQIKQVLPNSTEQEKLDALHLYRTENIGPITYYQLVERFGSAAEALRALPELAKRGGRKKPLNPPSEREITQEYKQLQKLGGQFLTVQDANYPLALTATEDAPPIISVLGDTSLLNKSCIAIVGARNASINGRKFAQKLAAELGARDQVVVSGLARGIDTAAHHGALHTGTIAVVAGGIDVVYPEENQKLYEEICEKGAVIAESKFGAKPFAASFPRRNRIVSGLSKGVIVVEATKKSGSLITARMAGEQGRDVYAVPGSPFDPRAAGPNHLIREGATLVTKADDVMEIMMNFSGNSLRENPYSPTNFTPLECANNNQKLSEKEIVDIQNMIVSHLSFTPISVDELIRACDVTISQLQSSLLELELAGRIKRSPGNRISLLEE
ncbi:MAG: DNA-protecting protein DprA [Alphaproteobacteria bacterium]|nr:DNA-protecting protein DprA [Alphaproteobacteria bacterium]